MLDVREEVDTLKDIIDCLIVINKKGIRIFKEEKMEVFLWQSNSTI